MPQPSTFRSARVNWYPRSFLQLILLGNVLVALPLLGAVGYTSFKLDDLARRGGDAMRQASQAAALGHELPVDLDRMERSLRQFEVHNDPALLDEYANARREWNQDSDAYATIPLLAPLAERVNALRLAELHAYRELDRRPQALDELKATLAELRRGLPPLVAEAGRLGDEEREAFRVEAEDLRRHMLIAGAVALTATMLLMWFARITTARLWSRFERAVLALGEGKLGRRIRIKGPQDMQRVGRRLEWLRRRLMALEEQRTQVLRHVSHELKTPLAALREGTSLLGEGAVGALSEAQAKIVRIMHDNVLRQQALIDGLLKLQQAGFTRERLQPEALRLDLLIEQILATHTMVARSKRLQISGTLAPLEVEGGREELTTIVDNLIANAIKFSPEGGRISVTASRSDELAVVDIVDDGPGIPAADRARIFEPFYRGQATRGVAGVGLGLAISHQFTLAHRGSLDLIETAAGAHFRVTLPLVWSVR